MHQKAIESYCFHSHPSLKIRCALIVHKDITENTKRIQNSYQTCCYNRWCSTAWFSTASNSHTQGFNFT